MKLSDDEMREEVWKPIKGYEGVFSVSSLGRIYSHERVVNRKNGTTQRWPGRIRKLVLNNCGKGYFTVALRNGRDNHRSFLVHRLVAEAFCTKKLEANEVNHKNGNSRDNRAQNLEWVTPSENTRHAIKHGLRPLYHDCPRCRKCGQYKSKDHRCWLEVGR